MNIIRTKAIELSVIPAMAYKVKLPAGGSGIKLLRLDADASAAMTVDKRTGDLLPYGKIDSALFPVEAFDEAAELTRGLPFSARGNIKVNVDAYKETEAAEEPEEQKEIVCMLESDEYKAIIDRYSDEKGRLNYALMNKDFIQFASKSKVISDMVASKAQLDDIVLFIVKSRATFISGKKESLDDKHTAALIETLDEIDPRSAFKELKSYIKRCLAK